MRNVVVTGGTRGIGLAIANKLAAAGYRVITLARKKTDEFMHAAEDVNGPGALEFYGFDLSDLTQMPSMVKTLRQAYGPLYGLVNNAGQSLAGILTSLPDDQIENVLKINVTSPILLTKYVARSMMTGTGGRIVNMASIVAATGYNGLSVYSASKSSLIGFTRSLARELGPLGITVNAVSPGFIATDMTHGLDDAHRTRIARRSALGRMATVEDVANTVEFLFSDQAKNITGTVMTVDAGNTA